MRQATNQKKLVECDYCGEFAEYTFIEWKNGMEVKSLCRYHWELYKEGKI